MTAPDPSDTPRPGARPQARTVFVRGVAPRSGTNYLRDLLLLHPDIGRARTPVWEDFVLDDTKHLVRYVDGVTARWPLGWGVDKPAVARELKAAMGAAISDVLVGSSDSPVVVAKTPSTRGIERFSEFFPDEVLVLLVRDGRSVVESLTRSFDWDFEAATHEWKTSAERVLATIRQRSDEAGGRLLLLRYEDVLAGPVEAVDRVAEVAGLPVGLVSPDQATSLPIRGSSDFGREDGRVHWKPVARDASFKPERRWDGWDERRHSRFNWIAGPTMLELGYELVGEVPAGPQAGGNHLRDVASGATRGARRLRRDLARAARGRGDRTPVGPPD